MTKEKWIEMMMDAKSAYDFRIYLATRKDTWDVPEPNDWILHLRTVLKMIKPGELKRWIQIEHSVKYGASILDQVFTIDDNPDKYNSTEWVIDLIDKPVQILGWEDVDNLTKRGVNQGLNKGWINFGFEVRAIKRGIDLEWHFHKFPPGSSV